jgi:2-methylcitrate dehydratase PrpD
MNIVTPGVLPASVLLQQGRPAWLEQWSGFAATFRPAELPQDARERARLVLLDSIGVIASGMQEPELRALLPRLAATQSGAVPAIGGGLCLAPGAAAFANGTAGTMLELDEGNQYARGHPGIHVVPALLAAAQGRPVTGDALLAALALGYEIGARIGIASKLRVTMHPHGTWGTVGAALAVAHLHGADAGRMREVINIASSFGLSTSRRTMLEGATVRNTYAGLSNQLGLLVWDLAQSGFLGEADGVGAVYGGIIAEDFRPEAMTKELGTRWEIARNYFKRHAACRYTHGALDALAAILTEGPLEPSAIERIEVDTYVWAAQLDLPRPPNMLSAKFSLPFALATTIMHGAATVPAFREPALREASTLALAERVVVREDSALTARLPGLRPARLRVLLRDGTLREASVETNRGDTEDPYHTADIAAKFHELADPVWGRAHAMRLAEAVMALDGTAGGLASLHSLLAEAPAGEDA